MDIWRWVQDLKQDLLRNDQVRLAYLLDELPGHVVDHRHQEVDACVAEALALAEGLGNPWIEVFVKHWHLQSRVRHRAEAKDSLADSVALLDFANQPATRDCPQSVCATQDLTSCYAMLDGKAYVEARIAAAEESLRRIGPTWPCFTCISGEKSEALVDGGRYEEALTFIAEQRRALEAAGELGSGDFRGDRVQALMQLGRLDEAWDVNERAENLAAGDSFIVRKEIDRARLLAKRGEGEAALAALPKLSAVADSPVLFEHYAEALVWAGVEPEDLSVDATLSRMARRLESQGCLRAAFSLQGLRVEAAAQSGRPRTGARALAHATRLSHELVQPLDAPAHLDRWQAQLDALPPPEAIALPDSPEAFFEADHSELGIEALRDLVDAATARWPAHDGLRAFRAQVWAEEGELAEARADLEPFVVAHPEALESVTLFVRLLAGASGAAALADFAKAHAARTESVEVHARVGFALGRAWMSEGRWDEARGVLEEVAANVPDALGTRAALAEVERARGNLQEALRWLDEALEIREVPDLLWDRMVVATLLGRWDVVRASAALVGMPVEPGEAPISERWGLCRVRVTEDDGERRSLFALRTGPVTARVLDVSAPSKRQRYDDEVVFDPEPLNPRPEGAIDDEDAPHIFEYALVKVLTAGGYTAYELDGRAPDEATQEALTSELDQFCVTLRKVSGDEYEVIDPETQEAVPAAYFYVAVSEDTPAQEVLRVIQAGGFPEPCVFPALAEAAGETALAAAHRETAAAWGLL